jgi:hypothetical protein
MSASRDGIMTRPLPSIDLAAPAHIETATFALG